jgi:hypothetical protein
MDAPVPARTSGTPLSTVLRSDASRSAGPSVPRRPVAVPQRRPSSALRKPRWSCTASQLAQRKPSRRQDEHPP